MKALGVAAQWFCIIAFVYIGWFQREWVSLAFASWHYVVGAIMLLVIPIALVAGIVNRRKG